MIIVAACPTGYTVSSGSMSCYKWHSTAKQWNAARRICLSYDGDLVSLDSEAKFDEFRSIAYTKGWLLR